MQIFKTIGESVKFYNEKKKLSEYVVNKQLENNIL